MLAACCKIVLWTDQENSAAYKAEPIRIRQISEYDLLNCQAMGTRGQESKGTSLKLLHIVAKKALKRLFKSCRLPCKYLSCPIYPHLISTCLQLYIAALGSLSLPCRIGLEPTVKFSMTLPAKSASFLEHISLFLHKSMPLFFQLRQFASQSV